MVLRMKTVAVAKVVPAVELVETIKAAVTIEARMLSVAASVVLDLFMLFQTGLMNKSRSVDLRCSLGRSRTGGVQCCGVRRNAQTRRHNQGTGESDDF